MYDKQGRSDFNLLQASLGGPKGKKTSPAQFVAFDLLYLDGHNLQETEFRVRRHLLADLIGSTESPIQFSETFDATGAEMLEGACIHRLEGIVAKRVDRPYSSGRSGDWIKIKCVASESFFIVGYERSAEGLSSLLLGAYYNGNVVYVGSVGTGFKQNEVAKLLSQMDKVVWKKKNPPVRYTGKRDVVWIEPTLIAEIEYRGWTGDVKLRHAGYKGLREFQDNAEVYCIED